MASSISQIRDGRIVTQKDVTTDYSLRIAKVEGGKLQLSNKLRTINMIDDIGGGLLRKVDFMDKMPALNNTSEIVNLGYLGRTVVYTGETGSGFEKGSAYRCLPVYNYTWQRLSAGNTAQLLKFVDRVADSALTDRNGNPVTIGDNDFISIFDSDDNPRCVMYYTQDVAGGKYIAMSSGYATREEAESASASAIVMYKLIDGIWVRQSGVNGYLGIFTDCTIKYISEAMGNFVTGHIPTGSDPSPAFKWELLTTTDHTSLSSFQTLYPIDNVCMLTSTPTCFYLGDLSTTSIANFTLDVSDLAIGQYYNNNILYFEIGNNTSISFVAAGSSTALINVGGDSLTVAGKYRANIEVLPDLTISVVISRISNTTQSTQESTYYGFYYFTTGTDSNVQRCTMTRVLDASGNLKENFVDIDETAYSTIAKPCHNLRRCVVKNGAVQYYLNASNSKYKEDGFAKANLTGEDGDVMVEIPTIYVRITADDTKRVYLFSSTPIPDNVDKNLDQIYNGIHPAFRVGGTLVSNQFEVDGVTPLRLPKNKLYVGAFESVCCHHGTQNLVVGTVKAGGTTFEDLTTPTGSFANYDSYPKSGNGLPHNYKADDRITVAVDNFEARSVAPYRNGEMVYVGMPGVKVVMETSTDSLNDVLYTTTAGADTLITQLTTDITFQPGRIYYRYDGTNYIKVDVVIGDPVPPNTYYNREYQAMTGYVYTNGVFNIKWANGTFTLSKGEVAVFTASAAEGPVLFNALTWSPVSGITGTCNTIDAVYHCVEKPINFNSTYESDWLKAMSGNPNWALNYKPITGLTRALFQTGHANGGEGASGYYQNSYFNIVKINDSSTINPITFPTDDMSCRFIFNPTASDQSCCVTYADKSVCIWYGMDGNDSIRESFKLFYDDNIWKLTDGTTTLRKDDTAYVSSNDDGAVGEYIDLNHRYLDAYKPGFQDPGATTPSSGSEIAPAIKLDTWTINNAGEYTYNDGSVAYKLWLNDVDLTQSNPFVNLLNRYLITATINGAQVLIYFSNVIGPDMVNQYFEDTVAAPIVVAQRSLVGTTVGTGDISLEIEPGETARTFTYMNGEGFDRKWSCNETISGTVYEYVIEHISESDTRQIQDTDITLGSVYGGSWVVAKYSPTGISTWEPDAVLTSDKDMIFTFGSVVRRVGFVSITEYRSANSDVVMLYNDNTGKWTIQYNSAEYVGIPARAPYNDNVYFTPAYTAEYKNSSIIKFRNTPLVSVYPVSLNRGYNINNRTLQLLTLLMVADAGTFDLNAGLYDGTLDMTSVPYTGTTCNLGNSTGKSSESKASSYRGIENLINDVGCYIDGIIPMRRYIDGVLTEGYWECINPGAYSDILRVFAAAKFVDNIPQYFDVRPGHYYVWHTLSFPTTGEIKAIDPLTLMPIAETNNKKYRAYITNGLANYSAYIACKNNFTLAAFTVSVDDYLQLLNKTFSAGTTFTGNNVGGRIQL